jgi:hypothetical protein
VQAGDVVLEIGGKNLNDQKLSTLARRRLELCLYVIREGDLSFFNISFAASRALAFLSVNDDPDCGPASLRFARPEPQVRGFTSTRHRSSISAIAVSVTSSFPAGMVARNLPLLISLRSDAAVSGPFGKNFATASLSV